MIARIGKTALLRTRGHAVLALAASIVVWTVVRVFVVRPSFSDLRIYRIEGFAVRDGLDLYGHLPGIHGLATYPPFAAIVFTPLTLLPLGLVDVLSVVANVGLLLWVASTSCRMVGVSGRAAVAPVCIVAAIGLWSEPVYLTFNYGQINLLLLGLILWDFNRPDDSRTRGIGLGIATAIKVTPGIIIVYLLLTRRFRFALVAAAAFVASLGISGLVDAHGTWKYWTQYLFDTSRVGRLENAVNQSIRGLLVRIDHTRDTRPGELVIVLVVLLAGLACAVVAHDVLGDEWGLPACAVTGLLTAPIAWSHHWVWCLPIGVLLWYRARRWVLPTIAVFCSFAVWAVPHTDSQELHFTTLQILLSGWYILFGLLFLLLTGWQMTTSTRRRRQESADGSG